MTEPRTQTPRRAQGRALHPDVPRRRRRPPQPVLRRRSGAGRGAGFDSVMEDNEPDHRGAGRSPAGPPHVRRMVAVLADLDHQPFAGFINGVKKYVVTSRPLTNPWRNAEAVAGPIEDLVRDLKARPGGDIGVHGSIQLARSLLEAGLVDELQFVVGPAFGLPGRRLFTSADQVRRLALQSAIPDAEWQRRARIPAAPKTSLCN